jgi:hypothetical protein
VDYLKDFADNFLLRRPYATVIKGLTIFAFFGISSWSPAYSARSPAQFFYFQELVCKAQEIKRKFAQLDSQSGCTEYDSAGAKPKEKREPLSEADLMLGGIRVSIQLLFSHALSMRAHQRPCLS